MESCFLIKGSNRDPSSRYNYQDWQSSRLKTYLPEFSLKKDGIGKKSFRVSRAIRVYRRRKPRVYVSEASREVIDARSLARFQKARTREKKSGASRNQR